MTAATPDVPTSTATADALDPIIVIALVVLAAVMATGTLFAVLITSG
ncbi:MAG TPA: hypothetical protein VF230_08745 [Acidimicrobiales bacterium]